VLPLLQASNKESEFARPGQIAESGIKTTVFTPRSRQAPKSRKSKGFCYKPMQNSPVRAKKVMTISIFCQRQKAATMLGLNARLLATLSARNRF
jgi:hypothetical protein